MKIQPPRRYTPPAYPTLAEVRRSPGLLSRLPRRWTASPRFVALLSSFVSLRAWLVGAGDPGIATPVPVPAVAQPESPHDGTVTAVKEAASLVVPFLEEAMEYDGRGTFGCVAVNPPTFFSEDEALELIQQELRDAGFDLEDAVGLEDARAPEASPAGTVDPRHFLFDFADRKRGVFIEYLSRADYEDWVDDDGMRSTAQSYDFTAASRRAAQTFQSWKTPKPVTFGIFFDPLAKPERPDFGVTPPNTQGLTDEQQALVRQLTKPVRYERDEAATAEKAREKLRDQVRHFIAAMQSK